MSIAPDLPIMEALNMMKREKVRRFPVVKNGKLVGIVAERDLLNASTAPTTTLSVWELNYQLSRITVEKVMTKKVISVPADASIEAAARIMVDKKVGGLPVLRGDELVGIITETDLFRMLLEMMGAREPGVRVTALVPEAHGQLAKITAAISNAGGDFISMGTFAGETPNDRMIAFKMTGMDMDEVQPLLAPLIEKMVDIRLCCD
jgi:acetoin utilization protein AcuB